MKKIILIIMICMCLSACSDNTKLKGGARMVKGDVKKVQNTKMPKLS